MRKLLTALFFSLYFIFFFSVSRANAESNFITDYSVTYNVLENALTHVAFDVTLTNATSQYYASSYNIQVGFKDIKNILVSDRFGKIIPTVSDANGGKNIGITFNEKAVGLDKKLNFTVSFDTAEIAQKSGKIWDINIPGLTKQKDYNSFDVTVIVPKYLENPSYIKPYTGKMVNGNLTFTKDELGESGISLAFGKEQIYNFNLMYHLRNPNLFPIKTEIALPASTNYQDIQISDINPKPQNVTLDKDGNWLAQYMLAAGKKIDINVNGHAKLMLNPKNEQLKESQIKEYTKSQPYWQTNDKRIRDLADRLKTPYSIFQYVADTLKYDFSRTQNKQPRIGAIGALDNPESAVCLEFTDLFIAIARAANIPAREVNGFAFTQNSKERPLSLVKDVLHAWPEYYDSDLQTWIMVDPTWNNTTGGVDYFHTLDFNHFAFVINGISSSYPIPAGGYKISDNNSKDVIVELGDNFPSQIQTLTLSEDFSKNYFSGIAPQGNILIKNHGHILSSPQELTVTSEFLEPPVQKMSFGQIPPFGYIKIPISFNRPPFLTNKTDTIKIAIGENYILKKIKVSLFTFNKWTILGGIACASFIITISLTIYLARNLPFFKQKG